MDISQEFQRIERLASNYEYWRRISRWSQNTKDSYQKWCLIMQEMIITYLGENHEVYQRLSKQPIDRFGEKISETFDYVMNQKWASIKQSIINKINAKNIFNRNVEPIQQLGDAINKIISAVPIKEETKKTNIQKQKMASPKSMLKKKIFIVHGHDTYMRNTVKRYVESLGLEPIILSEKANKNQTILEKLREVSKEVCYAVILYTPCDEGRKYGSKNLTRRARENVVLELGFFSALLYKKVAILLKRPKNVSFDFPNDFKGIGYIEYPKPDWKKKLRDEFVAARILP